MVLEARVEVWKISPGSVLVTIHVRFRRESHTRFVMTTAIGVAPFVAGRMAPRDVLRTAHNAAHDARAAGAAINVYSSDTDRVHQRRFGLLNDFGARAVPPGRAALVFQPRVDLATRQCIGAEALLRWQHPRLGEVSPSEFIPIIEQTSLARPTTA